MREIAVALPLRDGHVLAQFDRDRVTGESFCRALGGGIENGETAERAVVREFSEELGMTVTVVRPLGVIDNRFTFEGRYAHEMVHVLQISSPALDEVPLTSELTVHDEGTPVRWVRVSNLRAGMPPIYPAGILDLLGLSQE